MEELIMLEILILSVLGGALIGLIPFAIARSRGQLEFGRSAFLWTTVSGLFGLSLVVAIVYILLIYHTGVEGSTICSGSTPQIMCLSGPMSGQVFTLPKDGLIVGRDPCCSLRLPGSASCVSRRHCAIRWQGGRPVLVDLQSSCGTFLASGQRLMPNQPMVLSTGSRFYLGSRQYQFQLTI